MPARRLRLEERRDLAVNASFRPCAQLSACQHLRVTETAKGDQLLVHVKRTDMPSESLQRTIRIADSAVQRGGWDNEIAARIKKKMDRTFRHDSPCAAPASAARASAACARRTHRGVRASG